MRFWAVRHLDKVSNKKTLRRKSLQGKAEPQNLLYILVQLWLQRATESSWTGSHAKAARQADSSAQLQVEQRQQGLSFGCGPWSSTKLHHPRGCLCQGKLWLARNAGHATGWKHIVLEPRRLAACQATAGPGPRLWAPIVEGGFHASAPHTKSCT